MRYKYTITKEGGETEEMEAMSWKKFFKRLMLKYPDFTGWVSYFNKKGHVQVKNFINGKIVHESKRDRQSDQGSSGSGE